jgi:hypothetical protein
MELPTEKELELAYGSITPKETQNYVLTNLSLNADAGASPTHQASQRGGGRQLDKPAQILKLP